MFTKKKIKTPLFFTIFFVLITFTIPMTLYAGPSAKCPCFTAGEISRDISKADGFANCKYFDTRDGSGGGDFGAQIFIPTSTGSVVYAVNEDAVHYAQNGGCATVEETVNNNGGILELCSGKFKTSEEELCTQAGAKEACFDAILEAYPQCAQYMP